MIKTIKIYNHKSFHPSAPYSVRLDPQKTATYIYGLNGAGKSAIAEVIYGLAQKDPDFAHCSMETTDSGYRYLVYNHHYVERLIGQPIQGIFTVGEEDSVRQQRIQDIDSRIAELDGQVPAAAEAIRTIEGNITKEFTRAKNDIWKAFEWGKKTTLAPLLEGYGGSKEKFFNGLRTHAPPEDQQLDSIERLEKRFADVSGTDNERPTVSLDTSAVERIERDPIWEEPVEVSAASRLAPLVAQLGHADWVARGREFLHSEQCPFCQQGLPHDFREELAKLLEGQRKAKVDKIAALVQAYSAQIDTLEGRVQSILADPNAQEAGVDLAWAELRTALHDNLSKIRQKEARPSVVISIQGVDTSGLKVALGKLNALIEDFNSRVRDRKGERRRIEAMFYMVLYEHRKEAYAHHDSLLAPLRAAETEAKAHLTALQHERSALNGELRDLRRKLKGLDASIEAINERLRSIGITEFSIERKEGQDRLYCLARPGKLDCEPRLLSEGEKTLIAFLYFMESLRGTHSEDDRADPKRTIAVIDDPISSLSLNYVYDIATMIHRELAKPEGRPQLVKQVIVLTHNLFFFHELLRQQGGKLENVGSKCGLLRVMKNTYTELEVFDPSKLLNDYDVWWQLLIAARNRKVPTQVVPNAMRSILEQFISFTRGTSDFKDVFKRLSDDTSNKYKALERFLDRGSHRDAINGPPIDWSEYDVDYLLGKFREMFKAIDQEQHYLMKMGEVAQEPENA